METEVNSTDTMQGAADMEMPSISPGETAVQISKYVDKNGDIAILPKDFMVSTKEDEYTVNTGMAVIGPDIHGKPSIELSDHSGGRCYARFMFPNEEFQSRCAVGDTVVLRGNLLHAREPFGMTIKNVKSWR